MRARNALIVFLLAIMVTGGILIGAAAQFQNANGFSIFGFFKHLFPKHNIGQNNQPPGAPTSSSSSAFPSPSNVASSPGQCDPSLWNHVYHPARLHVVDSCKTVSGIIESIRVEKDGDFHIRLKVDPQFSSLINSANVNGQFGALVLEPICQNPVTQPDAIAACENFNHQNISVPPVGTHVTVKGSYVLDEEHSGWAEIHPVTSITQS
jgi:hypothetical protein